MKNKITRKIRFSSGIVSGDDMRDLLIFLPELEKSFKQRKQFDEYYFDVETVEITLINLDGLSNLFSFKMNYDTIVLNN
jgi:predicted RNA-binding protein associated with RNAse of E/G family